MAESDTKICNKSLARIGSKRINDLSDTDEDSVEAIQCRLQFEPTRDALLRSHYWPFASGRKALSQDTASPDFEWDNQFILPVDFLYLKAIFENNNTSGNKSRRSHALEGQRILTNDSSMSILYIKKITDAAKFDSLFVKVLVLSLALELVSGLAKTDPKLEERIEKRLAPLMRKVRALDRQETELLGRAAQFTWVDVRATRGGRIDSRLGSP